MAEMRILYIYIYIGIHNSGINISYSNRNEFLFQKGNEITYFASSLGFKLFTRCIACSKMSFFVILLLKDSICIIYSHQYVIASFAHEMNMFSRETHLRICGCSVKEMMSSGYTF